MLCIGHRGAMGHAPENTLGSISKALELGADCIEIDVHRVDDELLVIHDEQLERTTNGQGKISEHSLEYLRSLDAGNGEKIPLLEEVLDLVLPQAGLNVELKGEGTGSLLAEMLSWRSRRRLSNEGILVSSFEREELLAVRSANSEIKLGVLMRESSEDGCQFADRLEAFSVHLALPSVRPLVVQQIQQSGWKVYVYTVNSPEDIRRMEKAGVDGIFTDYPERVAALRCNSPLNCCTVGPSVWR